MSVSVRDATAPDALHLLYTLYLATYRLSPASFQPTTTLFVPAVLVSVCVILLGAVVSFARVSALPVGTTERLPTQSKAHTAYAYHLSGGAFVSVQVYASLGDTRFVSFTSVYES